MKARSRSSLSDADGGAACSAGRAAFCVMAPSPSAPCAAGDVAWAARGWFCCSTGVSSAGASAPREHAPAITASDAVSAAIRRGELIRDSVPDHARRAPRIARATSLAPTSAELVRPRGARATLKRVSQSAAHGSGTTALLVAVLLVLDAIIVAAFTRARDATAREVTLAGVPAGSGAAPAPVAVDSPSDDGWALCQTQFDGAEVTPSTVAITYLDTGLDGALQPEQVRAWFGELPGSTVDVYALAHKDGSRRVALELTRGKWPTWSQVAGGSTGAEVCGRVRAALLRAGIGRPASAETVDDPRRAATRHRFEFIYARRAKMYNYIQWLGTLDDVLEPARFAQIVQWLEPGATADEAR